MAFAESSVFPIPPDILIIPMLVVDPSKAWRVAFYTSLYSVLGGIVGYFLGFFLYDTFGQWLIDAYNYHDSFINIQKGFNQYGFWLIMLKGFTPIPFKLVTLTSGFVKFDFFQFIMASIVCRSSRYYALSAILYYFGETGRRLVTRFLPWIVLGSMIFIIMGYYLVKWVF